MKYREMHNLFDDPNATVPAENQEAETTTNGPAPEVEQQAAE